MTNYTRILAFTAFGLAAGCSADRGEAELGDGTVAATSDDLFADTDILPRAVWNNNRTIVTMCWKPSASRTDGRSALYTAGRQAVQSAISQTWDANSWIDVVWNSNCNSGGIPVEIKDVRSFGDARGVTLNFDFQNYQPSCKPTGGTLPNAAWTSCVRSLAVHEFGHVLGFDHEQNRGNPAGIRCASPAASPLVALEDIGNYSVAGDLPIGSLAAASVMSYCPEGWRDTLHATDINGVQALYGGEGRHVSHGLGYAIRTPSGFVGFNASGGFAYGSRLDRAFTVDRVAGAGSLRYGDKVRFNYGDKKLCVSLGTGTAQGTIYPGIVFTTRPYATAACEWTVQNVEGTVGGVVVDVNDPIRLYMKAPGGKSNNQYAEIPYDGAISIRLLGPFDPL